jgi:hypothetical protein
VGAVAHDAINAFEHRCEQRAAQPSSTRVWTARREEGHGSRQAWQRSSLSRSNLQHAPAPNSSVWCSACLSAVCVCGLLACVCFAF